MQHPIFFSMICNHFVSLDAKHIFVDTVLLNTYEPKTLYELEVVGRVLGAVSYNVHIAVLWIYGILYRL
jgi:hypothetical protein